MFRLKNCLRDFFLKKIPISPALLCLAAAAFVVFGCNFFFCHEKFIKLSENGFDRTKTIIYLIEIAFNYFLIFSLLYFASFCRGLFTALLFIICLSLGVASYSFNEFGVIIDQVVIANLFDNIDNFNYVFVIKNAALYSLFYIFFPFILLQKFRFVKNKVIIPAEQVLLSLRRVLPSQDGSCLSGRDNSTCSAGIITLFFTNLNFCSKMNGRKM